MWEDSAINPLKYEKSLSFTTTPTSEDDDYAYSKKKLPRDPLSHRIIEKRRRDRMNNCLSDLSRLIPSEYMKKGRGRVEKTEIIEMAIKHMKHLQSHPCTDGSCCPLISGMTKSDQERLKDQEKIIGNGVENRNQFQHNKQQAQLENKISAAENYRLGFNECLSETMHFLVEVEGFFSSDSLCLQLTSHLHNHCDNILKSKAFMAQLAAAAHSKRTLDDMEDAPDFKQVIRSEGYSSNGYQHSTPDSSRNGQHHDHSPNMNGSNGSPNGHYQSHGVFPADSSSSALQPSYTSFHNLPRSIAFSQQMSPTCFQGADPVPSYKFKEDIRKRFCKEAVVAVNGQGTRKIPGFALSPRGSYYIPLTLDLPYLDEDAGRGDQALLHPVTISVCFPSQNHHINGTNHQNIQDTGQ